MPASINQLMPDEGPASFYEADFQQIIEDHRIYLAEDDNAETIQIQANVAYRNEGDFYGVLREYDLDPQYFWIILRVNNFTSPTEYRADHLQIIIPSRNEIGRLRRIYRANQRLSKKERRQRV